MKKFTIKAYSFDEAKQKALDEALAKLAEYQAKYEG